MKIKLDPGALPPTRAHPTDAGLDLRAPYNTSVPPFGSVVIDTGVHVQLPEGTAGMLKSRSGLNVRHGITSEGVIDVGYTGSIRVKLYNHTPTAYCVKTGDRISQLVIVPILPLTTEIVEELDDAPRGENGFGSTGR